MEAMRMVRGNLKKGRRPYVRLEGARYSSELLKNAPPLIGQRLVLEVDPEDMCTVKAYRESGDFVDTLHIERPHQDAPKPISLHALREIQRQRYGRMP